jgi:hypothetical protein
MVMGRNILSMAMYMKDNIKMANPREKVSIFGKMG